jgi:N-carbamoylputrescine amidase
VSELGIALLQMAPSGDDAEANLAKGDAFCRRARAEGADIALFPEMWSAGYSFPDVEDAASVERWRRLAVRSDSPFVEHFRALARELEMAIAVTYLQAWPGGPRNSVSLINRGGEILLTYAKVHTCDFGAESLLTPGDDFPVCALETAAGPVQVGAMICYDREFPETARILMLRGAEVILTPNACDLEPHRIAQFRTRAYENMVAVAMANYAAPKCNGHSIAFDGAAFSEDGKGRDTLLVEAGSGEGVYVASVDLEALRAYRERSVWGNAYRRPSLYAELLSTEVALPFRRAEDRR